MNNLSLVVAAILVVILAVYVLVFQTYLMNTWEANRLLNTGRHSKRDRHCPQAFRPAVDHPKIRVHFLQPRPQGPPRLYFLETFLSGLFASREMFPVGVLTVCLL